MKPFSCVALAALLSLPLSAYAGPLSKTARGVDNAQDTHDRSGSSSRDNSSRGGSSSSGNDGYDRSDYDRGRDSDYESNHESDYDDDYDSRHSLGVRDCGPGCGSSDIVIEPEGGVELTLQSVHDSDGAIHAGAEVGGRYLGFRVQYDRYFEEVAEKNREDDVHIGLWQTALSAHAIRRGRVKGDLLIGLGGAHSSHFDSMLGFTTGAAAAYGLHPEADIEARGSATFFPHEISLLEGSLGVRVTIVRVAYRVMKFSVGPAVHGPEAGVALRF